jgi:excisionase family DNA binding protein
VERLLGPKEACQLLGISYSTLLRWIREGKIRAVTTEGGEYRIPYSEIKKYLELFTRVSGIFLSKLGEFIQLFSRRRFNVRI